MLVGNKCDLETERRVMFDDLSDKAAELEVPYFETSALPDKKSTIDELFQEVVLQLSKKIPPVGTPKNIKISTK